MRRTFALLAASVILVSSGILHGLWTNRWGMDTDLEAAVARLTRVPMNIGDWQGKVLELNPDEVRAAQLAGYSYRCYENSRTRQSVLMMLVCGQPGPISVHTPDVCFEGAGYERVAEPAPITLTYGSAEQKADFRTLRMRQVGASFSSQLRIFWSWRAENQWAAPENPRLSFARHQVLYKLYVLSGEVTEDIDLEVDPCAEFMQQLLPELEAVLSASEEDPREK